MCHENYIASSSVERSCWSTSRKVFKAASVFKSCVGEHGIKVSMLSPHGSGGSSESETTWIGSCPDSPMPGPLNFIDSHLYTSMHVCIVHIKLYNTYIHKTVIKVHVPNWPKNIGSCVLFPEQLHDVFLPHSAWAVLGNGDFIAVIYDARHVGCSETFVLNGFISMVWKWMHVLL